MTNQEALAVLEEAKKLYEKYEEYRDTQTAEFLGLSASESRDRLVVKDLKNTECYPNACLEPTTSTVQLY